MNAGVLVVVGDPVGLDAGAGWEADSDGDGACGAGAGDAAAGAGGGLDDAADPGAGIEDAAIEDAGIEDAAIEDAAIEDAAIWGDATEAVDAVVAEALAVACVEVQPVIARTAPGPASTASTVTERAIRLVRGGTPSG